MKKYINPNMEFVGYSVMDIINASPEQRIIVSDVTPDVDNLPDYEDFL